jgi:uncharacterized protein
MFSDKRKFIAKALGVCILCLCVFILKAQNNSGIKVIAFFTAKRDQAHITYVHEANKWFPKMAAKYDFSYDSTDNWTNLNAEFLSHYQVVLFLDTRPETAEQREAFQKYIERGGGWIGFHFAGFALNNSDYPQNWDWYHNTLLGCGEYASNTWRPTSAVLKVEDQKDPLTKNLPATFKTSPSEWYRWAKDLRTNPDIKILLSVDPSSFPLGTKTDETWHSGYYPIAWTNKKYNMLYTNWGHNDIDYENKTNKQLSFTFGNDIQDKWIVDAILLIGSKSKRKG